MVESPDRIKEQAQIELEGKSQAQIEINVVQSNGDVVNKTFVIDEIGEILTVGTIGENKVMTIHEEHGLGEIIALLKEAVINQPISINK